MFHRLEFIGNCNEEINEYETGETINSEILHKDFESS